MNQTVVAKASAPRFHSLDGVRAAMMLLGIFFHIAWFFIPIYFGHPMTDASNQWGFLYFFYWVHTFRMQAFFVIAGFFACLLIEKRGYWRFLGNRSLRVAIPFVLFTTLLYPVMHYQQVAGGLASGRVQSQGTAWQLTVDELSKLELAQLWPIHFWFLYCLLLIYGISLLLNLTCEYVADRKRVVRGKLQSVFERIMSSPFAILVLTLPVAGLMFWDSLTSTWPWFGIDAGPMKPRWKGVFTYGVFFAVGWCLYRRHDLLRRFDRGWLWRLTVGTIVACALCAFFHDMLLSGKMKWFAPMVVQTEIQDYARIRRELLGSRQADSPTPAQAVWSNLPAEYQRFVLTSEDPSSDQLAGFAGAISASLILNPEFADPAVFEGMALEDRWRTALRKAPDDRPIGETMQLNRALIGATFGDAIAPDWSPPLWLRVTYFLAYAFASWMLVFGTIGFFNQFFSHPSPFFRYMSDSSYWLYIIHLPLQYQILLWLGPIQMNWLLKYSLYLAISFAVLIPTYHYLVRSTWLGVLLNGRRYRFVPWFGRPNTAILPPVEPSAAGYAGTHFEQPPHEHAAPQPQPSIVQQSFSET